MIKRAILRVQSGSHSFYFEVSTLWSMPEKKWYAGQMKGLGPNVITDCLTAHQKKKAICHGIFESVIVVRAISPKDVVQLKSSNRLITCRWYSIKSVRYAERSAPTSAQFFVQSQNMNMSVVNKSWPAHTNWNTWNAVNTKRENNNNNKKKHNLTTMTESDYF